MTEQARRGGKEVPKGFVSPDLAAQLIEFLMSVSARSVTGRLLSARFDQATVRQRGEEIARTRIGTGSGASTTICFFPKSS